MMLAITSEVFVDLFDKQAKCILSLNKLSSSKLVNTFVRLIFFIFFKSTKSRLFLLIYERAKREREREKCLHK